MKRYYSIRERKRPDLEKCNLELMLRLFYSVYYLLEAEGYFQEAFGIICVDGDTPGLCGIDVKVYFFKHLRKLHLYPISERYPYYSQDDLFDVLELLHDLVSKPIDGNFHSYNQCGMHYYTFDKNAGQIEFRTQMNEILCDYEEGLEISNKGEIQVLGDRGLEYLLKADLLNSNEESMNAKINYAIQKFRRYKSTIDDRKEAVRSLADVLEYLRPQLKGVLNTQDEKDLFNIANNFGIRHNNPQQKTSYDQPIWLSWMFYYYLATIHASQRLIIKSKM